jgi:threonine synthase
LRESGWLTPDAEVVLLNTGTGLKYPETVGADPAILQPGDSLPAA